MTNSTPSPVLEAKQLRKSYTEGDTAIDVLQGVDLTVYPGEIVAIIGASGSGKSTLLHCLGLLDKPTSGQVLVNQEEASRLNEQKTAHIRNRYFGFVYQFHHLLGEFSALDNVAMPLLIRRESKEYAREQAYAILKEVGLSNRVSHYPAQLSGGERQRVALARALVTQPACVLADEPTGNLDRQTAENIFQLLLKLNQTSGTAYLIVTHDSALASLAHRQLVMENGHLLEREQAAG